MGVRVQLQPPVGYCCTLHAFHALWAFCVYNVVTYGIKGEWHVVSLQCNIWAFQTEWLSAGFVSK